jgi:transcriptional regulator with PAS, ATPase and Fis domain
MIWYGRKVVFEMNKNFLEIASATIENIYRLVSSSGITVVLTDESGAPQLVWRDTDSPSMYPPLRPAELNERFHTIPCPDGVYGIAAPIIDANNETVACLGIFASNGEKNAALAGKCLESMKGSLEGQWKSIELKSHFEQVYGQFLGVMETIPLGTFVTDSQLKIIHVNDATLKIFNARMQDIIGKKIDDYLCTGRLFQQMLHQGVTMMDEEMVFSMPQGQIRCEVIVTLIYGWAHGNGLVVKLKNTDYMNKFKKSKKEQKAYFQFDDVVGTSSAIQEAVRLGKIAARSTSNVLILGESGTGKELFAQAIHNHSPRREGPFVAINCGALPGGLIESELFGYEGGAFTGAKKEGQAGKFEQANGGTLFLDEIGDMPLHEQIRLLRVLQNKEIVRIGGNRTIPVNVRILAATNRDIEKQVMEDKFRKDLFFRINVFSISLPSLNDRVEDIEPLSEMFLKKYRVLQNKDIKGIDEQTREALLSHTWVGNIRELENVIERAVNIARKNEITLDDLPDNVKRSLKGASYYVEDSNDIAPDTVNNGFTLIQNMERNSIIEVLKENNGNISKASGAIGLSRRTFYRKLEFYNINHYNYK